MYFNSIRLYCFRNLLDDTIFLNGKDIFLIGENAQGKSNFLESVYFCSFASSFRNARDSQIIRDGADSCAVSAKLADSGTEDIVIKLENGKKQIFLNGKRCEDRKTLLSVIPSVVFCHEDLSFINDGHERRRWFFDQNKSLYDEVYLDDLRRYKKILKTRNLLLKEIKETRDTEKKEMLEIIDTQFVECGLRLVQKRREEIEYFSDIFKFYYNEVSCIENIYIQYQSSWKENDIYKILEHIQQKRDAEIRMCISLSGPHRDKYFFMHNNEEFSSTASTGQKRLLALILRVVQARRYSVMTNNRPVLLLDDVLLELDGKKREKFLACLPDYDQAFYTFLPEEPYQKYQKSDTQVFFVDKGGLKNEAA